MKIEQYPLYEKFIRFNKSHKLFHKGGHIIIAVSGGVDSMTLLELFCMAREEYQLTLAAAHFNHQLRGVESDADEELVSRVCANRQIQFLRDSDDVSSYSKTHKISIETAARDCRYAFFKKVADTEMSQCIATAHNANDNAETIIDRMIRGSGTRGLAGIPVKRKPYIRPLLFAERSEIEQMAKDFNIPYRTDASNLETIYRRNRIRHQLIPLLQQDFNPAVIQTLNRLGENMRETQEYIHAQSLEAYHNCIKFKDEKKIILDIKVFLAYFTILQKGVVKLILEHFGENNSPDFNFYSRLTRSLNKNISGSSFKISPTVHLTISGNELFFWQTEKKQPPFYINKYPGTFSFWEKFILEINFNNKPLEFHNKDAFTEWIDADKIVEPLSIRTVNKGDKFFPINLKGSKKLSDYLIDAKVPVYERNEIPILECASGIIWICGKRLDDRFKITENTRNILKLQLRVV